MILVTVGSTDFDALIRQMDSLAPELGDVVMQIGAGTYEPRHAAAFFRYAPSLEPYFQEAHLIVSHGGLGTVMEALRQGKKLVAVSNPDRYDAHQDDLLQTLSEAGHLVWCRDLAALAGSIQEAEATALTPYVEPECRIHMEIGRFLAQRQGKK